LSALFLRLGVGSVFIVHGIGKLFAVGPTGAGMTAFTDALAGLGMPFPVFFAWVVALTETIGGVLVLFGLFSRVAALGIGAVMLGAIFLVHLPNGFAIANGGYEYALVLLLASLALASMNPGRYSVEAWLANRERAEQARPAA
jgi:putative oxidoreductase